MSESSSTAGSVDSSILDTLLVHLEDKASFNEALTSLLTLFNDCDGGADRKSEKWQQTVYSTSCREATLLLYQYNNPQVWFNGVFFLRRVLEQRFIENPAQRKHLDECVEECLGHLHDYMRYSPSWRAWDSHSFSVAVSTSQTPWFVKECFYVLQIAGFDIDHPIFEKLALSLDEKNVSLEGDKYTYERLLSRLPELVAVITTVEREVSQSKSRQERFLILLSLPIHVEWCKRLLSYEFLLYDGLFDMICRHASQRAYEHSGSGAGMQDRAIPRPRNNRQQLVVRDNVTDIKWDTPNTQVVVCSSLGTLASAVARLKLEFGDALEFHGTNNDFATSILRGSIMVGGVPNEFSNAGAVYTSHNYEAAVARANQKFGGLEVSLNVFKPDTEDNLLTYSFSDDSHSRLLSRRLVYENYHYGDESNEYFPEDLMTAEVVRGKICKNPRTPTLTNINFFRADQAAYMTLDAIQDLNLRMIKIILICRQIRVDMPEDPDY